MEQAGFSPKTIRFGIFEVDLTTAELRKHGTRLRLQEQPFKVLAALLEQPGGVVLREDLVQRLWPDGTFVDFDRGLNAAVTRLRQVLGDSAENPRYVETVARRGYRFLAEVDVPAPVPEPEPAPTQPRSARSNLSRWIAIGAVAVFLTFIAIVVASRTQRETILEQITRDPGLSTDPAISPDGKLLSYASDRTGQNLNIWVKQLINGDQPVQLTHDDSDAHQPSFSPDGSRIVYRSERAGGGVYVIPTLGGEPQLLVPEGRNPRFSPDGRWVAYWVGRVGSSAPEAVGLGSIYVMPVSGGEPKRVGSGLPRASYPVWSSDSKQLLVYTNPGVGPSAAVADWWTVPIGAGVARRTGAFARLRSQGFSVPFGSGQPQASAWVGDTVTFSAQKGDARNIWRIKIGAGDGSVSGTVERLTQGTTLEVHPSFIGQDPLVFASLTQGMAIWAVPVNALEGKVSGELQRLTEGSTQEIHPSISADGRMLVYGSSLPAHQDIWLKDLKTGRETAIASTANAEWHPSISRDGTMVAYTVDDARQHAIYVVPAEGGKPKQIAGISGWVFDWSLDKQYLLFHPKSSENMVKRANVESGVVSDYFSKSGSNVYQTRFSPDGEWLAFEGVFPMSDTSDDSRLFIVKTENGLPASGHDWIQVSDEHGWSDKPRWSPDGNMLYYISDRDGFRCLWAQHLSPATKHPISAPFAIYHFHKSRLSAMNAGMSLLEIDVAKDKIVINLGELTGNIWSMSRR